MNAYFVIVDAKEPSFKTTLLFKFHVRTWDFFSRSKQMMVDLY